MSHHPVIVDQLGQSFHESQPHFLFAEMERVELLKRVREALFPLSIGVVVLIYNIALIGLFVWGMGA